MLKYAIIGLGGLGKLHLKNYFTIKEQKDVKLVALCDVEPEQFEKKIELNIANDNAPIDLSQFHRYTDLDEMLANEEIDFVVTAVPTYLHAEIAVKLMDKGIHVFSEKPMALNLEECQRMIDTAKRNQVKLQIGQCVRFDVQRMNLKKLLDEGKYGKVIRAEFSRISKTPLWSWQNWYMDFNKSGGAALDLHVHDVDCVQWLFGMPQSVVASATHAKSKFDTITSNFNYDGFYVTTMTDWSMTPGVPFTVRGVVNCEGASIFLQDDRSLKVCEADGNVYTIPCDPMNDMYVDEVIEFIDCIETGKDSDIITPESTMNSIKMALAEQEAALKGERVYVR